jgi:hypothetical protein
MFILEIQCSVASWDTCPASKSLVNDRSTATTTTTTIVGSWSKGCSLSELIDVLLLPLKLELDPSFQIGQLLCVGLLCFGYFSPAMMDLIQAGL